MCTKFALGVFSVLLGAAVLVKANPECFEKCVPEFKRVVEETRQFKKIMAQVFVNMALQMDSYVQSFQDDLNNGKGLIANLTTEISKALSGIENFKMEANTSMTESRNEMNDAMDWAGYPPVNFVYTQYHLDKEPVNVWPKAVWKDITKDYEGLFFRAEGGDSEEFGNVQGDNTRRITEVGHMYQQQSNGNYACMDRKSFHCWRPMGAEVGFEAKSDWGLFVGFKSSTGEVRPRNAAVKLWKRMR